MRTWAQLLFPAIAILLVCACLLAADRVCSRCNAKSESDKWVYCPFCGTKYEGQAPGAPTEPVLERDRYERVSLEKLRVDHDKFKHRFVCFEARFEEIQHHFATVEMMGISEANYVNFYVGGNWTNYIKRSNVKLVERLKRVPRNAKITVYGRVEVLKNFTGTATIVVLVDDIDL